MNQIVKYLLNCYSIKENVNMNNIIFQNKTYHNSIKNISQNKRNREYQQKQTP